MKLSDWILVQGQFHSVLCIFHYCLHHWMHQLQSKYVFIDSLDQIELIPTTRSFWKYHFYQLSSDDSYLFTLLPPYWNVTIHYSTFLTPLYTCPHYVSHIWNHFVSNVSACIFSSSLYFSMDVTRHQFYLFISQLRNESMFDCIYCSSHQTFLSKHSNMDECLFPKRILYSTFDTDPLVSSLEKLNTQMDLNIRSSPLKQQLYSTMMELMFTSWKQWLQSIHDHIQIQQNCLKNIESIWIKKVPFLSIPRSILLSVIHSFFEFYTEITDWDENLSPLIKHLQKTSFLLLLLFPNVYSHQSKVDQSFSFQSNSICQWKNLVSSDSFEHRFFDTHPLRLGEFYESFLSSP